MKWRTYNFRRSIKIRTQTLAEHPSQFNVNLRALLLYIKLLPATCFDRSKNVAAKQFEIEQKVYLEWTWNALSNSKCTTGWQTQKSNNTCNWQDSTAPRTTGTRTGRTVLYPELPVHELAGEYCTQNYRYTNWKDSTVPRTTGTRTDLHSTAFILLHQ